MAKKTNNNSEHNEEANLFNQHRVLIEKANKLLVECKKNDTKKLQNGYEWVTIDNKTKVLRKKK